MATGRTVQKHSYIHMRGIAPLTSWAQSFGPLVWEYDEIDATTINDSVKGYLPGQARVTPTTFNWTVDPATSASYWYAYAPGPGMQPSSYYDGKRLYTIALGIRGTPVKGDPAFCGQFVDRGLTTSNDGGLVTCTLNVDSRDTRDMIGYSIPWGILLHTYDDGQETAANTAVGIDQVASTSFGGYMVYMCEANGTATVKVQDAAVNTNPSFADVTGLTTGVVDFSVAANQFGIVAAAATQTIRQFVRWQIVLGTATTLGLVLTLVRRYGVGQ